MSFEELWGCLQENLAAGATVQHWSIFRGDLKGEFEITSIEPESIHVSSTSLPIPKNDFRVVAELWDDYCAGDVPRSKIRDLTRYSTYIISILHWQEEYAPLGSSGEPEGQRSHRIHSPAATEGNAGHQTESLPSAQTERGGPTEAVRRVGLALGILGSALMVFVSVGISWQEYSEAASRYQIARNPTWRFVPGSDMPEILRKWSEFEEKENLQDESDSFYDAAREHWFYSSIAPDLARRGGGVTSYFGTFMDLTARVDSTKHAADMASLRMIVLVPLCGLFGFIAPWGAVRAIAWVFAGSRPAK